MSDISFGWEQTVLLLRRCRDRESFAYRCRRWIPVHCRRLHCLNIHNYNDLFKTDGCFVLAEDYVEMEMFLSESEFEEAMKLYKDAMPISSGKKIEGRTDFFLGKYKLNENPDYYKLYLVQGKMYNQSFIDTRICDYVKVPDYRSDANLHNILFPTPYAYYKVVKPYKKSKEQQ